MRQGAKVGSERASVPRWGHRAGWGRVEMETRNLAAPQAPRHTWVGSSTLLTPPLQGMLADGPPAVPPGKTGDVGIGDTITRYLWRFRELDTFGSPGCLVQDGERALLLPGRSQMIPTPHRPSPTKDMPVPLPTPSTHS